MKSIDMTPILRLISIYSALILTFSANGQGFLRTSGPDIVDADGNTVLLRGMGLGGWMLQEGYMLQTADFANAQYQIRQKIEDLIGESDTDLFYEQWRANHVRKIDIDSLKAWGFNSVRLPMHYNLFTLPIEAEPEAGQDTWLAEGFELTDSLIAWCKQNEMYVVLDLHAAPGGQGYDQGISDYDPTKPSLWESAANRNKTVALWRKIAERYADEPWVAGYDLLNEPNWNLPGNTALRKLYEDITDAIRQVDENHILFIEGNWFANDFTGLTPPWDDKIVYSPHKYWSTNDQASIQWVLDIRNRHEVPIYFGESGENSNTWFRDAIRLLEDQRIGWAWWPMKKVESIAGPLSVNKSPAYQALLNYWAGTGSAPSAATAKNTLLQLAEDFKMENCRYQKDVIDAMFRQVRSDATLPYRTQDIPGTVFATDFDMGIVGEAYFDNDLATYHVSTGNYTAWNQGWAYRNDGVDIEEIADNVRTNGYNLGWVETGEWMQYDIAVATAAVYDVRVRCASAAGGGAFRLTSNGAEISPVVTVPNSGGWQNWQDILIRDVVLTPADNKLRFLVDAGGFNLSSFHFVQQGPTIGVATQFHSAFTANENTIHLNLNKPISSPIPPTPADFELIADGAPVSLSYVGLNPANPRMIFLAFAQDLRAGEDIRISYTGTRIKATDGTPLETFSRKPVRNTLPQVHQLPGRIQAEDYFFQLGVQLENTTDVGGGQNISYLDAGDYLDYYIGVPTSGMYGVAYRTAAESATGQVQMLLVAEDGNEQLLHTANFPATGGWQNWATYHRTVYLEEGIHHLRIRITQPLFNMNWFEFSSITATEDAAQIADLRLFPNPTTDSFSIQGSLMQRQAITLSAFDTQGRIVFIKELPDSLAINEQINLAQVPAGTYFVVLTLQNGEAVIVRKMEKQ